MLQSTNGVDQRQGKGIDSVEHSGLGQGRTAFPTASKLSAERVMVQCAETQLCLRDLTPYRCMNLAKQD